MLGYALIVLGLITTGLALALLHWALNADGMLWVQVRSSSCGGLSWRDMGGGADRWRLPPRWSAAAPRRRGGGAAAVRTLLRASPPRTLRRQPVQLGPWLTWLARCRDWHRLSTRRPTRSLTAPPHAPQLRRRLTQACFYVFTLRRDRPVPLSVFYDALTSTYASSGFARQLGPDELQQLALQAGFAPTAAAALRARAAADAAAAAAAAAATAAADSAGEDPQPAARASPAVRRLPAVTIPLWRYKYFLWWLRR